MAEPSGETGNAPPDTLPLTGGSGEGPPASPEAWVGRVVAGRYLIERVIGRGGMGFVFEARHVAVGRRVAVKILRPEAARNPEAVARFHREAQAAAAVGSRHIVEILDFGYSEGGGAYLVMELLEGEDLGALVRRDGALPPARAVGIAAQVAEALAAAHARGIVHRDLKSGNVFVLRRDGRDFIKVVDFGVSKVLDPASGEGPDTHQGAVVGTPHYMAPEQGTDGRSVDHRADLYALGCILFEMLTGELPFSGATPVEVLYKHVHEARRRPSSLRPGVPRALDDLVLRLMAKRRESRPADARAVAEALAHASEREPGARWAVAAAILGGSLALTAALAAVGPPRDGRREAPEATVQPPRAPPPPRPLPTPPQPPPVEAVASAPVVLTVVVRPSSATVLVDGEDRGARDGVLVLREARGAVRVVRAEAPGHAAREERVTVDGDTTLRWTLTPEAPREPRPARTREPAVAADAGAAVTRRDLDNMRLNPYDAGAAERR